MSRKLHRPVLDITGLVVPIKQGGNQSMSLVQGAIELDMLTYDQVDQVNRPPSLDLNGKLSDTILPAGLINEFIHIEGPSSVTPNTLTKFYITDYDQYTTYVVTASGGFVTHAEGVIYFTAPSTVGPVTLTINGYEVVVAVDDRFIRPPKILTPTQDFNKAGSSLLVQASPFSVEGQELYKSLRFKGINSNLSRTFVAATDSSLFKKTYSMWVKRGSLTPGVYQCLISAYNSNDDYWGLWFDSSNRLYFYNANGTIPGSGCNKISTDVFTSLLDINHIQLVVDTTSVVAEDRVKIYINNVRITNWSTNINPSQNTYNSWLASLVGSPISRIGSYSTSQYFNGYLANIHVVDGEALEPSAFAEVDPETNQWVPKAYTGTYGNNGFYLDFSNYSSIAALGYDKSGRNNNWTPNNFSLKYDDVFDSIGDGPTTIGHASSDWQLSTDADFTNIISQSTADTSNLSTWAISDLAIDTDYFIRVRYTGNEFGTSDWSTVQHFKTRSSWLPMNEIGVISAADKATSDNFGISVALSDDGQYLAVGAYTKTVGGTTSAGQVYVYVKSGTSWVEEAVITAADKAANDKFGISVAIDSTGSRIAIGAYTKTVSAIAGAGKVYVYTRSGISWTEEGTITASDKAANDNFGRSIAMDSDGIRMAVGAALEDPGGTVDAGKVYIYTRSGSVWTQESLLNASDKVTLDWFGIALAMDSTGSRLAVGAPGRDPSAISAAGQVYTYVRSDSTWTLETTITASDKVANDQFGISVAYNNDGTVLAIGSAFKDLNGITDNGKVYLYTRSGSVYTASGELLSSSLETNAYFGSSLSFDGAGSILAIGSNGKDVSGITDAGQVYLFS